MDVDQIEGTAENAAPTAESVGEMQINENNEQLDSDAGASYERSDLQYTESPSDVAENENIAEMEEGHIDISEMPQIVGQESPPLMVDIPDSEHISENVVDIPNGPLIPENPENNAVEVIDELPPEQQPNFDENSSSSDDQPFDLPSMRYGVPTSEDQVQAAVRELISRGRRSEGGIAALLNRENFLHRMRRVIYSMDRGRGLLRSNTENNNRSDEEDEMENTEEPEPPTEEPENAIRFDTNLPTEHSYLGANMARVSSVNYLEVGLKYKMMLFMHHHILFPGEILPFMISGSIIESDIDAHNGLLFGVCFPFVHSNIEQDEHMYGVTCQIYEKGTDKRGNTLVKSSALQRFVVKCSELTGPLQFISAHGHGKCYGYVKILPEIFLPEPLKCINMGSMNRFRDIASMQAMFKRFQAATTPWPASMYEQYNISSIIEKARNQLAQHKINSMPSEPISLSFWLIRNLHLSESMMKTLFMTDSVNVRMNLIASTFKEEALFTCRYCGNRIANCRELFAMSKHGVQTQYCNSAGYIHETNTVYQVMRTATSYSGQPSTEFSWFPGYQWQVIVCKVCSRHIGWEFKAIEPNLVPVRFYGISSSSVQITSPSICATNPRAEFYNNLLRFAHRATH